jgi:acyl carrier protein
MPIDLVRDFLLREFFFDDSPESLPDEEPLITSGRLNSVDTHRLVTYLEREFTIELEPQDIVSGRLDTLKSIATLIEEKRATGGS